MADANEITFLHPHPPLNSLRSIHNDPCRTDPSVPPALLSLCLLSSVLASTSKYLNLEKKWAATITRGFLFWSIYSCYILYSNESYKCYWKSFKKMNLCKCLVRLDDYTCCEFTSCIQGDRIPVFLKIDGKYLVCSLGDVSAYTPKDVQMQNCIDCSLVSSLHPRMTFCTEILLRGWLTVIREKTVLTQCSPSGLSCCHLNNPTLGCGLLVQLPGVTFQPVMSESAITEALWHFETKK